MSLLDSIDEPALPSPTSIAGTGRRVRIGGSSAFDRALRYVEKMQGGIMGQYGSIPCMRAAVACARGFELSVEDTVRVLQTAHNPNCTPEWSEDELRHKAQDAAKSERVPLGYLLRTSERYVGDHGVADDEDTHEPSTDAANDNGARVDPTAEEPLRGLTHLAAVALLGRDRILELAAKPIEYVWQDIVVAGTIVLVAGPPADGKTTLLFLILAARANLEAPIVLLGRKLQPAPPGQYLVVIEGEHSEASTSRKLVKSLRLLGVDDMALDRVVIVARKAVQLGSPEWADVVRMVEAGLVSDIAIDTVARVAPADADNEREQVAVFAGVAGAIEAAPDGSPKPTVWAVAHTRKNNTSGELTDVSGSAQRVGQSDTVLMVKAERADGRVISSRVTFGKLREDPDEWPEPAELVIGKAADGTPTLTIKASPSRSCGDNMAPLDDGRPLEARIIDQLRHGAVTKNALATVLRRSKKDLEPAITNLFATRSITTVPVTIKGTPRTAFELTERGKAHGWPIPDSTPDSTFPGLDTGRTPDGTE